jgi:hypothetical protein
MKERTCSVDVIIVEVELRIRVSGTCSTESRGNEGGVKRVREDGLAPSSILVAM